MAPMAIEHFRRILFPIENSIYAPSSSRLKLVGCFLNHHLENLASLPLVTWIAFTSFAGPQRQYFELAWLNAKHIS
jgi:hypothetical protein